MTTRSKLTFQADNNRLHGKREEFLGGGGTHNTEICITYKLTLRSREV
jgi:hypothetical protein